MSYQQTLLNNSIYQNWFKQKPEWSGKKENLGFLSCVFYYKLVRGDMITFASSTNQEVHNELSTNDFEQFFVA